MQYVLLIADLCVTSDRIIRCRPLVICVGTLSWRERCREHWVALLTCDSALEDASCKLKAEFALLGSYNMLRFSEPLFFANRLPCVC